jgi:hypothetical protein
VDAQVGEHEGAQKLFALAETGSAAAGRTEEAEELDTRTGEGWSDAGLHRLPTHLDGHALFVPRKRQTCD